ncbi:TonB-dependent siderophore receptor [Acinetobacter sp. S40]|uniref:TonB-dependent siderophore receptor n=1 Tax=Acinetobacter sp. S40 TaxID=2767434 RepID=UPI00190AC4CA|nr:TonB-dependent siderophore receptor [Acinetobacter sp. S40]MBJ9984407.1 TonB-dependent siderophore receptor [Acinetobacter sp. S40]
MRKYALNYSILLILFSFPSTSLIAATPNTPIDDTNSNVLPVISLKANAIDTQMVATYAHSALKSNASIFETAQSVSVITREQLDQRQATTLADAITGVAGVSAGYLGRRGWDDFFIRGQNSSDQIFIDGLKQSQSASEGVSVELSGMEQVQIIKGPASVNFGLVQPGGMVNLVTKRPQAQTFANAALTYGSYDLKQATFDMNYAPNQTEKGAFRLTGRIADQNDPTDYVYFKNFYISPSYNFDLGDNADLSVIASYQHREYMRQQGLPVIGTLKYNPNGSINRDLYIGEPEFGDYEGDVYRTGWTYNYAFDNGWRFTQNAAIQKLQSTGRVIFTQTGSTFWVANTPVYTTLNRSNNGRYQTHDITTYSIDNSMQRRFNLWNLDHDLNIGIDAMQTKDDYVNDRYTTGNLNVYQPIYGQTVSYVKNNSTEDINRLRYIGFYIRDRIDLTDKIILSLAGRQDWAQTSTQNISKNGITNKLEQVQNVDQKFTGNVGLLYNINDMIAPYASYATSFLPNTRTNVFGHILAPETGKQVELGIKLQSIDQRIQASIALYDLCRQNVATADPNNSGSYVLNGEQQTRGIETEINAYLLDRLKLSASYSHLFDAKITKDTLLSNIGLALNNVPQNTYSLSSRYYLTENDSGWYVGGGIRGESSKSYSGLDVHTPSYLLYDAETGYEAALWGAQLSIKNLFDKDYYAGLLNTNMVTLGNPRQINFTVKFKY